MDEQELLQFAQASENQVMREAIKIASQDNRGEITISQLHQALPELGPLIRIIMYHLAKGGYLGWTCMSESEEWWTLKDKAKEYCWD